MPPPIDISSGSHHKAQLRLAYSGFQRILRKAPATRPDPKSIRLRLGPPPPSSSVLRQVPLHSVSCSPPSISFPRCLAALGFLGDPPSLGPGATQRPPFHPGTPTLAPPARRSPIPRSLTFPFFGPPCKVRRLVPAHFAPACTLLQRRTDRAYWVSRVPVALTWQLASRQVLTSFLPALLPSFSSCCRALGLPCTFPPLHSVHSTSARHPISIQTTHHPSPITLHPSPSRSINPQSIHSPSFTSSHPAGVNLSSALPLLPSLFPWI